MGNQSRQHRGKVPLRLILVVPFVLQIFTVVGLVGYFSFKNGQRAVNTVAEQLQHEVSDRVNQHLNDYLALPHQLNQLNADAIDQGILNPQNLEETGRYFWKQAKTFENISWIGYALADGKGAGAGRWLDNHGVVIDETINNLNYTYNTDSQGRRIQAVYKTEYDATADEWYIDTVRLQRPNWSRIAVSEGFGNYIAASANYPLYDRNHHLIGALSIDLLLASISDFLKSLKVSPSGQIFIIERNGLLIASSELSEPYEITGDKIQRINVLTSSNDLIRATSQQLKSQFGSFSTIKASQELQFRGKALQGSGRKKDNYFVNVTPWKDHYGLDWLVVIVIPESDFMATIHNNARMTVGLCLAALAIATGMGLLTSRWLVCSITRVIRAADALSRNDWQQVPEANTQEMAQLAGAFNRMAEQLQESFTQLEYTAHHDPLTGLPNQRAFRLKLLEAIVRRQHNSNFLFAVLFLDLDYFKLVNDSLGHLAGDKLLTITATRLKACIRPTDTIARFGGDEFVILLEDIADVNSVIHIAERISREIQHPFYLDNSEVFISTSIGIVLSSEQTQHPDSFLSNADIALYRAKVKGKAAYELFDSAMQTEVVERLQLETDLRRAIERQELEVYYQPIFNIRTGQILGLEALVRWHHATQGPIPPNKFIPVAEETGLIVEIGMWILYQACYQMQIWQQQFPNFQSMTMSVNLSSKQFLQVNFIEQIEKVLQKTKLLPGNLKLEITESVFLNYEDVTRAKFHKLQALGVKISIDDFGTGYSSLSYLHRFPINTLKIDRSFIQHLNPQNKHLAIIEAIVSLAHNLGMDVIAEGVETEEQIRYLDAIGCEKAQGHLFSPAVPAFEVTTLFQHQLEELSQS
ncbi:EAL domain-containing protein [Leptolyngbya sp. PL-A3]